MLFIGLILPALLWSTDAHASVLSYRQWKAYRVQQAKSLMHQISIEFTRKGFLSNKEKARLKQAKTNIEIAQELGPNDYFLLYLGPQFGKNKKALAMAAKKMSSTEMADILLSYNQQLEKELEIPTRQSLSINFDQTDRSFR